MAGGSRNRRALGRAMAGLAAVCAVGLALPAVAPAATPGVVVPAMHTDAGTLGQIQSSGARNVRVFAPWNALEPQQGSLSGIQLANFDDFVNRVRGMGLGVDFVV